MANNTVDYSKYETLRQRLQNEFSRRKYNMLLELASRTMPEDNYEEDMDKEN